MYFWPKMYVPSFKSFRFLCNKRCSKVICRVLDEKPTHKHGPKPPPPCTFPNIAKKRKGIELRKFRNTFLHQCYICWPKENSAPMMGRSWTHEWRQSDVMFCHFRLPFAHHVDEVVSKANRMLDLLIRSVQTPCACVDLNWTTDQCWPPIMPMFDPSLTTEVCSGQEPPIRVCRVLSACSTVSWCGWPGGHKFGPSDGLCFAAGAF